MGGKYLEIEPDRAELARREIDMATFQSVVQTALGGMSLAQSVEGRERYNIMLRYDRPFREDTGDLDPSSFQHQEARTSLSVNRLISYTEGPPMIRSENARLTGWVFVDIADRDIGSYVSEARERIASTVDLPPGYAVGFPVGTSRCRRRMPA